MSILEILNAIYWNGIIVLTLAFIAILIIAYPTLRKTSHKKNR